MHPWLTKQKSHEIFRFTASTVDIPTRWNPRAKQQQRVALADFSAAPWQGFEKSERGPNSSSLFQPLAAVVVVAVRILPIAQKESPAHESVSGILGATGRIRTSGLPGRRTTTGWYRLTMKREFCWFCTFAAKTGKSPLLVVTTGFLGI